MISGVAASLLLKREDGSGSRASNSRSWMIKSENSDNLKIFGKIVDKLHLVLYNKLTKKNKRKGGQITPLEYLIIGNFSKLTNI